MRHSLGEQREDHGPLEDVQQRWRLACDLRAGGKQSLTLVRGTSITDGSQGSSPLQEVRGR